MALRGLISLQLVFACGLLPFSVFGFKFEQDGSLPISRRCECDSVEFWLPRRTNGASSLLSYEEIVSNTPNNIKLLSKKYLAKGLRLWLPKHCELLLTDNASIFQRDAAIDSQNIAKKTVEVFDFYYRLSIPTLTILACSLMGILNEHLFLCL